MQRLFIGGIPDYITLTDLKDYLEPIIPIFNLHIKRKPGSKPGYAFFEVASYEDARRLTEIPLKLQDVELYCQLSHKTLKTHGNCMKNRVFLRDLPKHVTDEELYSFISLIVEVRSAYAIKDKDGVSKGYGFADLKNEMECDRLVQLEYLNFGEYKVRVEKYTEKIPKKEKKMAVMKRRNQQCAQNPRRRAEIEASFYEGREAQHQQVQMFENTEESQNRYQRYKNIQKKKRAHQLQKMNQVNSDVFLDGKFKVGSRNRSNKLFNKDQGPQRAKLFVNNKHTEGMIEMLQNIFQKDFGQKTQEDRKMRIHQILALSSNLNNSQENYHIHKRDWNSGLISRNQPSKKRKRRRRKIKKIKNRQKNAYHFTADKSQNFQKPFGVGQNIDRFHQNGDVRSHKVENFFMNNQFNDDDFYFFNNRRPQNNTFN